MDPFVGEIRIFPWNWAPQGWALCNGASLPAQQNMALYALLGTTFGGTGQPNFNLPDLQGRTPIGTGQGADGHYYPPGEKAGLETVTLQTANLPMHNHSVNAVSATKGDKGGLVGNLPATVGYLGTNQAAANIYGTPQNLVALAPDTVGNAGGSTAHDNMQPFTVLNFCIATLGLFPPRQ